MILRRRHASEERPVPVLDLLASVRRMAGGSGPVLAGPFVGEVGFELLYWLPFLRWAQAEVPELRGRLVLVSRGGTDCWAPDVAAGYVDLLDHIGPEELVARRTALKQRAVTALDEELLATVRERIGVPNAPVLHPSLVYNFYYMAVKADRRAFAGSVSHDEDGGASGLAASYRRIPPPPLEFDLPEEFVAVRFYTRSSLPGGAATDTLARDVVANLSRTLPVVLLDPGTTLDDHGDVASGADGDVIRIADRLTPADNLRVQTAVLARARGFVGTYGGLAYLAPHLGVPSLGLRASSDGLQPWHLDLAERLFEGDGWGALVVVPTQAVELLDLALGGLRP